MLEDDWPVIQDTCIVVLANITQATIILSLASLYLNQRLNLP